MREVDDSHHAEHNRQPRADEREEGDHVENLEQNNGYVVHAFTNIRESDSFNIGKAWPKPPDALASDLHLKLLVLGRVLGKITVLRGIGRRPLLGGVNDGEFLVLDQHETDIE